MSPENYLAVAGPRKQPRLSIARGVLLSALLFALGLAAPTPSQAAVTIGSDLAPAPTLTPCESQPCTSTNSTLPGEQLTSPIDGVVVRWRVRVETFGASFKFNVIRDPGGGAYTAINASTTHALAATPDTVFTFPARQPIAAGDYIGVSIPNGAPGIMSGEQAGVTRLRWEPPLAVGEFKAPLELFPPAHEVLVNADVEPDCDSDGFGDETQDPDTSSCNPPPPSPLPEPTPPPDASIALSLDAKRKQPVKRLKVKVSCGDEACEAELRGKAVAKRKGGKRKRASAAKKKRKKTFKVKPKTFSVPAGEQKTKRVKFKKNKKSVRKLRRLLSLKAWRKGTKVTLKVSAIDAAGNGTRERTKVKLRR